MARSVPGLCFAFRLQILLFAVVAFRPGTRTPPTPRGSRWVSVRASDEQEQEQEQVDGPTAVPPSEGGLSSSSSSSSSSSRSSSDDGSPTATSTTPPLQSTIGDAPELDLAGLSYQFMSFVGNELALERGEERRREREVKLGSIARFLSSELDREESLRRSFVDSEVQREREYKEALGSFVDGEVQREREYKEALERFVATGLERQGAAQSRVVSVATAVVDRAVTDERAAFDLASGFLDSELARAFPELAVCTDGLACGPSGGFDLFEACSAYKHALQIDGVIVRTGHCERVCPRNGAVTVRCRG